MKRCSAAAFPSLIDDALFVESLSCSVAENVRALRDVLVGDITLDDVPLENRLRFTNMEAQMRVTQVAMQRSYRLSFFLQWQEWSQLVASIAERLQVGATEQARAQQSLAATVMVYHDAVVSQMSANLAASEEAMNSSRHHIRQRLIEGLLAGDDALDPADLVTLDYAVDGEHVAVLLPNVPAPSAGRVLATLRRAIPLERSLVYGRNIESAVLWLGSSSPWTPQRIADLVDVLRTSGETASVSAAASGRAGLREAHAQVESIEEIRRGMTAGQVASGVLQFADVRLEILLTQSPALAQEFVRQELGPLAADTVDAARLRDTIAASFRFGSHVAAAESLGLHEHTVRNRLQRAQELIGPLQDRRTELQVALRLRRLYATG
ncbi:PucR family transcriptional regulator [Microbacterium sp. RD1]|uniref:PucR family transcriptional regulator n=1 Tax=Microbacterium sp. RD1 TaxID=3457313 RepID=UPI003FA5CCA0